LPFVRVSLDVVFQLIKAELKQWLIGQCSLWGYDKRWPENIAKKDDQKTLQRKMIRKHGCFVSTALRRVGRWRRRRSLDSISTNIQNTTRVPLVFLVTWQTTFALFIFKPIFTEIHRAREAKVSYVNFNADLSNRITWDGTHDCSNHLKKTSAIQEETDSAAKPTWRLCSSLIKLQILPQLITWRTNCHAIKSDKNVNWNSAMCFEVLPMDVNCYLSSNIIR